MKYSEMSKVLSTSEGALKASYHLAVKKNNRFFSIVRIKPFRLVFVYLIKYKKKGMRNMLKRRQYIE